MSEPSDPSTPVSRELTGRIGKYEIKEPIGKGAMGQVYLAHDTVLKRDVALKVMAAQIADDVELKARFLREAQAVAQMMHPNVVTVFDLGSHTDGSPYIAMELLKGQDLQKTVRQTPTLSLERKVQVIIQVLTGLNHAHQAGIVHRDIKPANIFILQDDTVKIMDFGVARLTSASMTGTGNIVGTADYMSPEFTKTYFHKIIILNHAERIRPAYIPLGFKSIFSNPRFNPLCRAGPFHPRREYCR